MASGWEAEVKDELLRDDLRLATDGTPSGGWRRPPTWPTGCAVLNSAGPQSTKSRAQQARAPRPRGTRAGRRHVGRS
jgi:hypothetical protein